MKRLEFLLVVLLIGLGFTSCDNFEGEQTIPSYIRVHGFNVVANPSYPIEQGEDFLTNDITDVWVYVDQMILGCYSLPKNGGELLIPILKEGKHKIELQPGIKYNGMSSTREYYRFYTTFEDTLDLRAGEVLDIEKKNVMYNESATFAMTCFFENSFSRFMNFPNTTNENAPNNFTLIFDNDSVKYGSGCLAFYSGNKNDSYKILTRDSIACKNHYAMILELDYHSNIPFEVGVYGKVSSQANYQTISAIRMKANQEKGWQKMYIILGKVWEQLNYQTFQLYLQPFNPEDLSNGYVHVDNIKLIHFPQ